MTMRRYLIDNGVPVTFAAIDAPGKAYADASAPLAEGRKHECYVTSLISAIYAAAAEVKDYRTMQFLDWFVKEQGEEEKNADDLVKKMKLFGGDPKACIFLTKSSPRASIRRLRRRGLKRCCVQLRLRALFCAEKADRPDRKTDPADGRIASAGLCFVAELALPLYWSFREGGEACSSCHPKEILFRSS